MCGQLGKGLASSYLRGLKEAAMATATLVIGVLLFAIGIIGQLRTQPRKQRAHPGDRNRFISVVTIGSIVVGFWLLAISAVHILHNHHHALHYSASVATD